MTLHPPLSSRFPYMTLFRSLHNYAGANGALPPGYKAPGFGVGWGWSALILPFVEQGSLYSDLDRKSTRLNSSHMSISYAVFCLKKKKRRIHSIDLLNIAATY